MNWNPFDEGYPPEIGIETNDASVPQDQFAKGLQQHVAGLLEW